VDLNAEAIQICQLSLWIKTAARGKQLTSLDHTIREGNSVISDPAVHPKAFDWQAVFPEVFAQGGFDVVVGNPPYIRQELLSPFKPWLEAHYEVFHGMADLYVYFYELDVRLLKPGGLLCYIVTNKWMKAGYGEPLRRFFNEKAWVRSVVDFGHAKQIFEKVDVFPSIILVEKPTGAPKPKTARLCTIPRGQLRIDDLSVQIEREGTELELTHPHHRTLPYPRRRSPDPGAHPQRPRQPSLPPHAGGDCPDVANRSTPHAHSPACDMIVPHRIPKGFRLKAQGCEQRATLGWPRENPRLPQRGCGPRALSPRS
jgi:hypothetical protein